MDNGLIVFLKSSTSVEQEDLDIILSYRIKKLICVVYSYTTDMLEALEDALESRGYAVDFMDTDGRQDRDLFERIKTFVTSNADRTLIDVTFASPFHSALVMNLGGSEKVEIFSSDYMQDGTISNERLDRIKYIYNGLSESCYCVMDAMTRDPQYSEIILDKVRSKPVPEGEKRITSKSAIYDALDRLASLGLVERCEGRLPEGYTARRPNFYRINIDQEWDYFSFKRLKRRRELEMQETERRKNASKESNRYAKRVAEDRRRKNPRRK